MKQKLFMKRLILAFGAITFLGLGSPQTFAEKDNSNIVSREQISTTRETTVEVFRAFRPVISRVQCDKQFWLVYSEVRNYMPSSGLCESRTKQTLPRVFRDSDDCELEVKNSTYDGTNVIGGVNLRVVNRPGRLEWKRVAPGDITVTEKACYEKQVDALSKMNREDIVSINIELYSAVDEELEFKPSLKLKDRTLDIKLYLDSGRECNPLDASQIR